MQAAGGPNFYIRLAPLYDGGLVDTIDIFVDFSGGDGGKDHGYFHPSIGICSRLLYFLQMQAAGEPNFYSGLASCCDGEPVDTFVGLVGWRWRWWDG